MAGMMVKKLLVFSTGVYFYQNGRLHKLCFDEKDQPVAVLVDINHTPGGHVIWEPPAPVIISAPKAVTHDD
ncbi:MAG: hypothetical protein HY918_02465 [Candidatus Doudnabacteria bacterium]|nr:hypothetical protein [Candidatus Doudnabacteria bacterium]